MLLNEFIERTHYYPTYEEWERITEDYNNSPLPTKDEYCKKWVRRHEYEGASCRAVNRLNALETELRKIKEEQTAIFANHNKEITRIKERNSNDLKAKDAEIAELRDRISRIGRLVNSW